MVVTDDMIYVGCHKFLVLLDLLGTVPKNKKTKVLYFFIPFLHQHSFDWVFK